VRSVRCLISGTVANVTDGRYSWCPCFTGDPCGGDSLLEAFLSCVCLQERAESLFCTSLDWTRVGTVGCGSRDFVGCVFIVYRGALVRMGGIRCLLGRMTRVQQSPTQPPSRGGGASASASQRVRSQASRLLGGWRIGPLYHGRDGPFCWG